jgi:secretion/DNA translocation related CpaE-like protein
VRPIEADPAEVRSRPGAGARLRPAAPAEMGSGGSGGGGPAGAERLARGGEGPAEVVLLTRDRALTDHVAALADAAGAVLRVLPAPGAASRGARLTLVGLDLAGELAAGVARAVVLVVRVEGADPPEGVWRQAVEMGAEHVALLPEAEGWLVRRLMDAAAPPARAPVLAVVGGCGGAGASSLAIALAVTAAEHGLRPVLVDADPFGGGLDLPLGLDDLDGLRWPDLPWAAGRLPAGVIESALPEIGGLRVLACTRGEPTVLTADGVAEAVDAARRSGDLVVVDLPRRVGDAEAAVLARSRRVLLVVPSSVRAAAAGSLVAAAVEPYTADVRVVVRGPVAAGCDAEAVADALMLPLEGELGAEPGLAAALEAGEGLALRRRGPLATLSRRVLADVLETG